MIKDVYMTGRIGDYVMDIMHPNIYFVLESGREFKAPIYSEKMYEDCKAFRHLTMKSCAKWQNFLRKKIPMPMLV